MSWFNSGPASQPLGRIGILTRFGAQTGGIEVPHDNGHSMPRNERCELGELKVAGLTSFTVRQQERLLSPWTGYDSEGEGCGERK